MKPNGSVPKAVASSVAPSASNSVPIQTRPQKGPYKPATGSSINPQVARPDTAPEENEIKPNPAFGGTCTTGAERNSGGAGAPTVPDMNGQLFRRGPIDTHYQNEFQGGRNPYRKINNPPTRGMFTRLQDFQNHFFRNQDKTNTGFHNTPEWEQQRTSHMRNVLPPMANGFSPETYTPRQRPQAPPVYKYNPVIGTQAYGTGVLNTDTYGAGQTAGGVGGNNYTPTPGPPETTSTAANQALTNGNAGMPTWG